VESEYVLISNTHVLRNQWNVSMYWLVIHTYWWISRMWVCTDW